MAEDETIANLMQKLQACDNSSGYRMKHGQVMTLLEPVADALAAKGEEVLDPLYELIKHEETWSCTFALRAIGKIGSIKSVPYLVTFIRDNEEGDYWDACDDAMYALTSMGKLAVDILIGEVKSDLEKKIFYSYLIEALTTIKDDRVCSFMIEIVRDYIDNHEKYSNWFHIDMFTYGFSEQENKDILPLLMKLLKKDWLTEFERREIEDTVLIIEDPNAFRKKNEDTLKSLRASLPKKPIQSTKRRKIGRNEPCPCGSGKKYKKCCLGKDKG